MNQTIWKFPLAVTDRQTISLPLGAEILTAQMQYGDMNLWVLLNPEATQTFPRTIEMFGTGRLVPEGQRRYISTVQQHGGVLVWHIFEAMGA